MKNCLLTIGVLASLFVYGRPECPGVKISCSDDEIKDLDGDYYIYRGERCNDRLVYHNIQIDRYLYHKDESRNCSYWYIADNYCHRDYVVIHKFGRVRSTARYPEYTDNGRWQQRKHNLDQWADVDDIEVDCIYDAPKAERDGLPVGAVVGIVIGCMAFCLAVIPGVVSCIRTARIRRQPQQNAARTFSSAPPCQHPHLGHANPASDIFPDPAFIPPAYGEIDVNPPSYDQVLAEAQLPELKEDLPPPPPYNVMYDGTANGGEFDGTRR